MGTEAGDDDDDAARPARRSDPAEEDDEDDNPSAPSQSANNALEGTLIYRNKAAKSFKRNVRLHAVFDMSGAAGACLDVGGMGSLKFYSSDAEGGGHEKRQPCLDIPGHMPWTVVDIENDPTGFVVEISTAGWMGGGNEEGIDQGIDEADTATEDDGKREDAQATIQRMESNVSEGGEADGDGVFDFWQPRGGGEDSEGEGEADGDDFAADENVSAPSEKAETNQVERDLERAVYKNKPCIRYAFKVPSKNNEKARWIAAFDSVGRLSERSKKRKNLFGGAVSVKNLASSNAQKNSRMRPRGHGGAVGGNAFSHKEYRVRPHYAYLHRWMTQEELTAEMEAPSALVHDARLSPTVATAGRELGLLRVEVLQCLGLPRPKGKKPSPVAYLVCGSYAFATDVIPQCQSPQWLAGMKRACALPIYHGYAALMAGVFDDGGKGKDTYIGRIEIPLAQLRPGTTYDVTLPLRQSTSVYNRRQLGAMRLRVSLEYYDERQVFLSYLPQRRREAITVACADEKSFRNVALVVHGNHLPDQFSTNLFKASIRELTFVQAVMVQGLKQSLRDLVAWRNPLRSAYAFFGWMLLVYANSIALAPAYVAGFALLLLASSYMTSVSSRHAGFSPPSPGELLLALSSTSKKPSIKSGHAEVGNSPCLLGAGDGGGSEFMFASYSGHSSFSVNEALAITQRAESFAEKEEMDEEDDDDGDINLNRSTQSTTSLAYIPDGFAKPLPEQNIEAKAEKKSGKSKSIAQELQDVEEKFQRSTRHAFNYTSYHATDDPTPPFGKQKSSSDLRGESFTKDLDKILGVGQFSTSTWNPLVSKITTQLIPIIRILQVVLSIQRAIYNLATWRDPILSFWVTVILLIGFVVLVIFPWRFGFFAIGLFFLGPQNWVLRVVRERYFSDETKPGRVSRALRELFKKEGGNSEPRKMDGNPQPQPIFHCHAPASNPLFEKTVTIGSQHISVPCSPLYSSRFYDWPPDPNYSRVLGGATFTGPLCPSSFSNAITSGQVLHQKNSLATQRSNTTKPALATDASDSKGQKSDVSGGEGSLLEVAPQDDFDEADEDLSRKLSSGEPKKNRVSSLKNRLVATRAKVQTKVQGKLGLEYEKYKQKQSGKASAPSSPNYDSVGNDVSTLGDGIPSIIETAHLNEREPVDIDANGRSQQEEQGGTSLPLQPDSDEAVADKESDECMEPVKTKEPDQMEENGHDGHSLPGHISNDDRMEDDASGEPAEEQEDEAARRGDPIMPAVVDSISAASPGACPQVLINHTRNEKDCSDELDGADLQPPQSPDSLLQQVMAMKLELATLSTENDNYRMRLKEVEIERDEYKAKYEKTLFLGLPSSSGKQQNAFGLVSRFGKSKSPRSTQHEHNH